MFHTVLSYVVRVEFLPLISERGHTFLPVVNAFGDVDIEVMGIASAELSPPAPSCPVQDN